MGRIDDGIRMAQPSTVSPSTRLRRQYVNMINERDMLPAEASPETVKPPKTETPKTPKVIEQVAGGMAEGIQQTLQTLGDIGLPYFNEMAKQIPYIPKEDGAVLNLVRGLSRFGTVAIPAMMATGPLAGGIIADFVSTPPDEENISALLRKYIPELENSQLLGPITKALSTDPNDAPALNRLRNVLEGGVLGALTKVVTNPKKVIDAVITTVDEMRKIRGPMGVLGNEVGAIEPGSAWYRGGRNETGAFRLTPRGENHDLGRGVYLTSDEFKAAKYAKNPDFAPAEGDKTLRAVNVNTEKVFEIEEDVLPEDLQRIIREVEAVGGDSAALRQQEDLSGSNIFDNLTNILRGRDDVDTTDILQRSGFDAISDQYNNEFPQIAVFDPSKITEVINDSSSVSPMFFGLRSALGNERGSIGKSGSTSVPPSPKPLDKTQTIAKEVVENIETFRRPGTPIPKSVEAGLSYDKSIEQLEAATPMNAYSREELVAIKATEQTYMAKLQATNTQDEAAEALKEYGVARRVFLGGRAEAGGSEMILNTSPAMNDPVSRQIDELIDMHANGLEFDTFMAAVKSLPKEEVAPFIAHVAEGRSLGKAFREAALEAYVFSKLSIKSSARAFLGTGTMIPLTLGERWLAGTIGNSTITRGEVYASIKAMYDNIPKAMETWFEAVADPNTALAFSRAGDGDVYVPKISAEAFGASGPLGKFIDGVGHVIRGVGRPLVATDKAFQVLAKSGETHALAWREAVRMGQGMKKAGKSDASIRKAMDDIYNTLVKKPTQTIDDQADFYAKMVTLTDQFGTTPHRGVFDSISASAVRASNDYMLFKFFAPFLRNNLRAGIAVGTRLPLGSRVFSDTQDQLLRGTPEGQAIKEAKDAIGVGLLGLSLWMAHEGRITGAAPKDPKLRAEWEGRGFTPHSIVLAFDENGNPKSSVSVRGLLSPVTEIFTGIASLYHSYKWAVEHSEEMGEDQGTSIMEGLLAGAEAIADIVNDDTYGNTFMRLMTDISRGNDPTKWLIDSITPAMARDMAAAFDPYRTRIDNATDAFKNVVPWMKEEVPSHRGFLGEHFQVGQAFFEDEVRAMLPSAIENVGVGILRNASPAYMQEVGDEQSRAIYKEIARVNPGNIGLQRPRNIGNVKVNEEIGNAWMAIRGGDVVEVNGIKNRKVEINGKDMKTYLYDLISSDAYKKQPIGVKDIILEVHIANFSALATIQLNRLYPQIELAERESQRYLMQEMSSGGRK